MEKEGVQKEEDWQTCMSDLNEKYKDDLIEKIEDGFSIYPTSIQNDVIFSYIDCFRKLKHQLFFVQAPGGSGKTLSFVVPAMLSVLQRITEQQNKANYIIKEIKKPRNPNQTMIAYEYFPWVVILADTKPLVEQLVSQVEKCIPDSYKDQIGCLPMYSDRSEFDQIPEFYNGVGKPFQILVTTPLQLANKIQGKSGSQIALTDCQILISDEAELVYKQFGEDLNKIINNVKQNEAMTCIFASATLTTNFENSVIKEFSKENLIDPQYFKIKINLEGVQQYSIQLPSTNSDNEIQECTNEIVQLLTEIYYKQQIDTQIMIFMENVGRVEKFHQILKQNMTDISCDYIHSKMKQDRQQNNIEIKTRFQDFRDGKFKILICTDIMARGIDIDKVGLVINVFAPRIDSSKQHSDIDGPKYMHRIARTGRYVKKGIAVTYLSGTNRYNIIDNELKNVVEKIEGLNGNVIEDLNKAQGYLQTISKQVKDVVEFNTKSNISKNTSLEKK